MKKKDTYNAEKPAYSNLEIFQSIDTEKDWAIVRKRIGFSERPGLPSLFQVAAILIMLLSVGFLTKVYLLDTPDMIVAATGEQQQEFSLPDGSLVYLNSHSELQYPEKFRRARRSVRLIGEGFFEISQDPGRPFLVNIADRATVEVLGTSFNINSQGESDEIHVHVVDGRVAFYTREAKRDRTIMNKGDQAELREGQILLNTTQDVNFLSWRTGVLSFLHSPIDQVVAQLEKHYWRTILLDKSISTDLTFTSTIDNQELEDVLEEMSLVLELIITYNPDTITISKQH